MSEMEEVSALRVQVDALKLMIMSKIKREVETAVTNFRLRKGKRPERNEERQAERKSNRLQKRKKQNEARQSKEAEEEREYRLRKNRERKKKFLSKETEEARLLRLQRSRENKKKYLSKETEEARLIRLRKSRENNKKYLSKETADARLFRLQKINRQKRKKFLKENFGFDSDEDGTESKDEVFLCPMCNQKYYGRRGLKIHMAWHKSKKDFKCRNCGKDFEKLEELLDHCHKTHGKEIPDESQKKRNEKTKNKIPRMLEIEKRQKRKIHKCEICLEEFGTLLRFNYHVISHEKETYKDLDGFLYSCGLCGKTFGKMYSLFQHNIHHPPDSNFNCIVCGQQSEDLDSLCIHHHKEHTEISENMLQMLIKVVERRKNKTPREVFECGQCPRRFWDYKIYADHLLVHLQETEGSSLAFQCPLCENECDSIWKTLLHLTDHPNSGNSKCKKCGESFADLNLLTTHFYNEHFEAPESVLKFLQNVLTDALGFGSDPSRQTFRPLPCKSCGLKFAYSRQLASHKYNIHKLDRPHQCESCGKQFKSAHNLEGHKKIHLQNSRIKCQDCYKTFANDATYQTHYTSIHLNEKRYQCKVCEKRFASASVLHVHKTSFCEKDKAEKRSCPTCARTFDNYLLLYYHKVNAHRYGNTEDTVCHLCNKNFTKSVNLHAHNMQYHKTNRDVSDLSCNICGTKRGNSNFLFDHWLTHCEEKAFSCPLCDTSFKQRCGFQQHKRTYHPKMQLKMKTDVMLVQELKTRFRKELESNSTPNCAEVIPEMENASINKVLQSNEVVSNDNPNVNLSDIWTLDENTRQDNISATQHLLNKMDQSKSNVNINYVDFSRANVPEESLKHETAPSTNFTAILNNCNNKEIIQSEVAEDINQTNVMIVPETSLMDDNDLSNESFSLDNFYDSDDHDTPDLNDVEDVKPIILNDKKFPDDPFSQKLIVQLSKLKEFNCVACDVVLYTEKHFKVHSNSRSHRSALKQHKAHGTKVKEENEMENIKSKGRKLLRRKANFKTRVKHEYKDTDYQSCLLCTAKFRTTQALKRHYVSRHNGKNILKCKLCVQTFLQDDLLQSHLKIMHKEEECEKQKKIYVCSVCQETFTSLKEFKDHSMGHKNFKYKCVVCQDLKDTQNDLEDHYTLVHQDEMPFKCEECDNGFPTISRLELHKENVHGQDGKAVKGHYSCEQCGKVYRIRSMLMAHVVRHDQKAERQFICDFCPRSFTIESSLAAHRRTHTGEKPYSCSQCQMSFFSSRQLRQHNYTIHLNRKHVCEICGKSFTKNSKLTEHIRTHTGETPYPCKQCDRSFLSSSHLKNHVDQVHLGIKYVCDACGSTFNDARNLRKHRKRHNGVKALCHLCSKEYATPQDLQRHIDTVHLKLPVSKKEVCRITFVCSICSQKFLREAALTRHNEVHNPSRPFGCDLCTWRFNFNSNLLLHRKNVHEKQGIDYWSKARRARKASKVADNETSDV